MQIQAFEYSIFLAMSKSKYNNTTWDWKKDWGEKKRGRETEAAESFYSRKEESWPSQNHSLEMSHR